MLLKIGLLFFRRIALVCRRKWATIFSLKMRKTFPFSSLFRLPMPPPPPQPTRSNMCPGRRRCLLPSPRFFYFSSSSSSSFRLVPLFHRRLSMAAPDGYYFAFPPPPPPPPPSSFTCFFSRLFPSHQLPSLLVYLEVCVAQYTAKKLNCVLYLIKKFRTKKQKTVVSPSWLFKDVANPILDTHPPSSALVLPPFFLVPPQSPQARGRTHYHRLSPPPPPPPCLPQTKQHATIPPP